MKPVILKMVNEICQNTVNRIIPDGTEKEEWDLAELNRALLPVIPMPEI